MINDVLTGNTGGFLFTTRNSSSSYICSNPSNPMQGVLRMSGNDLQVFDGTAWLPIGMSTVTVNLSPSVILALDWCQQKMNEEHKIKELAKNNVTVAGALNQLQEAREALDIVVELVK